MRDAGTVTVIEARDDGDVEGPPSAKAAPLMGHPRYCPQSGGPDRRATRGSCSR